MKIQHRFTKNTGEVMAVDNLTAPTVGDMAGTWYYVIFDDGLTCWVKASSVEEIDPRDLSFSGPEEAYDHD